MKKMDVVSELVALDPAQLPLPLSGVRLRQQLDNHDRITRECGLVCPLEEDRTRQEFKDETDVNRIVARFFPFAPPMNPVQYGEQDMGVDLFGSMLAIQNAKAVYGEAPSALLEKYPTFETFVEAFMSGQVVIDQGEAAGGGSSPPAGAPSASGSAPVVP